MPHRKCSQGLPCAAKVPPGTLYMVLYDWWTPTPDACTSIAATSVRVNCTCVGETWVWESEELTDSNSFQRRLGAEDYLCIPQSLREQCWTAKWQRRIDSCVLTSAYCMFRVVNLEESSRFLLVLSLKSAQFAAQDNLRMKLELRGGLRSWCLMLMWPFQPTSSKRWKGLSQCSGMIMFNQHWSSVQKMHAIMPCLNSRLKGTSSNAAQCFCALQVGNYVTLQLSHIHFWLETSFWFTWGRNDWLRFH